MSNAQLAVSSRAKKIPSCLPDEVINLPGPATRIPKGGRILFVYPTIISEAHMTLALLGSILRNKGFTVKLLVHNFKNPMEVEDFVKVAKDFKADAVAFTMLTINILKTYEIVKAYKKEGMFVMVGGPHIADCPVEALEHGADLAVSGEGELVLSELCDFWNGAKDALEISEIEGVTYRGTDGEIHTSGKRKRMKNLGNDTLPDFDLYDDFDPFRQEDGLIKGIQRIFTSRGCPAKCTFCDWKMFGQKMAYNPIVDVVEEIKKRSEKYGIRVFTINDDTFTLDKRRVFEFCKLISQVRPKISWKVSTRANLVFPELLAAMKESGCIMVTFGLESGDEDVLKRIGKRVTIKQNINAPIMAHEAGLQVFANMMTGFPFETPENIDNNIKLVREIWDAVYLFQVSGCLVPFPGTAIYREFKDEYNFENYWLDPKLQHAGIQTYQNHINPFSISTYYARNLFDDSYVQEDIFFKFSKEYKKKMREYVLEIGKHNIQTLYSDSILEQWKVFNLGRLSMKLHDFFPQLEKKVGGFIYNKTNKRAGVERTIDVKRSMTKELADVAMA